MNAFPVHFVYSHDIDKRIYGISDVDKHWSEFIYGREVWLLQTYCLLKNYLSNITLGTEPLKGAINIIHGGSLRRNTPSAGYYFVNARADYRPAYWVNFEIVQNKLQERNKAKYITHWPQPGLIRRDKNRKKVENVAFLGAIEQNVLTKYPIAEDLRTMGLNYMSWDRERWNDFSDIDILVGIRQFGSANIYPDKPPSKLINAWWAEVPLISGTDSAFSQTGIPGEDYQVVYSYNELLDTINKLQNTPDLYTKIIQNGKHKRERYSREKIIDDWIHLFEHEIFPDYFRWQSMNGFKKVYDLTTRLTMRNIQRGMYKFYSLPRG